MKRLILAALLAAIGGTAVAQDDLPVPEDPRPALEAQAEKLAAPAKKAFTDIILKAQDRYKKVLDYELKVATAKGSLELVKAIEKEMEEFKAEEAAWESRNHKTAIKRYLAETGAGQKKYNATIDLLIRKQVQKKNLPLAEALKSLKSVKTDIPGLFNCRWKWKNFDRGWTCGVEFKPNGNVHSTWKNWGVWKKWEIKGGKLYVHPVYFDLPLKDEMIGNNPEMGKDTVKLVREKK
jgi:hypothetical protein